MVSSNTANKSHSARMVDELLLNNGYDSKVLERIKQQRQTRRRKPKRLTNNNPVTTLRIPHLSDQCTAQIKRAANSLQIPVRVVTTPGRKLKNILCSSRPLDRPTCPHTNCRTCNALGDSGQCTDQNVVYNLQCALPECQQANIGKYYGETYRPIGERFVEHYRSAKNPTADSYKDKPLAKHYTTQHKDYSGDPKIDLEIVERASSTMDRKIKEARIILKNKPDLNDRDEQNELRKFLV